MKELSPIQGRPWLESIPQWQRFGFALPPLAVLPKRHENPLPLWHTGEPLQVEELRALNYQPHRHSFLKHEVEVIVNNLGEL